jgi:pyrrolidone-carboxylate peptidase
MLKTQKASKGKIPLKALTLKINRDKHPIGVSSSAEVYVTTISHKHC